MHPDTKESIIGKEQEKNTLEVKETAVVKLTTDVTMPTKVKSD